MHRCACVQDTSHEKFRDTYLPVLKNLLGSASPSYLFASHLEPDHAGALFVCAVSQLTAAEVVLTCATDLALLALLYLIWLTMQASSATC